MSERQAIAGVARAWPTEARAAVPAQPAPLLMPVYVGLILTLAALVLAGGLLGALGAPLRPAWLLGGAMLLLAPVARVRPARWRVRPTWTDAALLLVLGLTGWRLLAAAGPGLLPPGDGPDAAHHTALAAFLRAHRRLPDASAEAVLREMAAYPPGFALLSALAADLTGLEPARVVYPLAALAVLLGMLGLALLAATTAPRAAPLAASATLLGLLAPGYTLGVVAEQQYYPQALAQALIIAAAVLTTRQGAQPAWTCLARLALVLLALAWVYTTWLPVALLATALGLLARPVARRWRALDLAVALLPALLAAALLSRGRLAAGGAVLLHEGSTIRAPWQVLGMVMPLLALVGAARGLRRSRWPALALLLAAVAHLAVLWWLWQRGLIAGYIYYKGYYLLALLLPLPIAWLLADLTAGARVGRFAPLAQAALLAGPLALALTTTPSRAPVLITPELLATATAARGVVRDGEVDYALQRPGIAAYWLHVAVLGQPRDERAAALLDALPLNFETWYFHPQTRPLLILEQPELPDWAEGLTVHAASACCLVVEKHAAYPAALERRAPFSLSFRTVMQDGRLKIFTEVYDHRGMPLRLRLMARRDGAPLATRVLALPQRPGRVQYVGFDLDPATLGGTGYRNAEQTHWPPAALAGDYELVLQLLQADQPVHEEVLAVWRAGLTINRPFGAWHWWMPPAHAPALPRRDLTLGDRIALQGVALDTPVVRPGSEVRVRLTWRARQAVEHRYRTFVQLIAADGGAATSIEGDPGGGSAPTWRWQAGDQIADAWRMPVPASVQPGRYTLVVGMYDPANGRRLEAWQQQPVLERYWSDALPLGVVEVRP